MLNKIIIMGRLTHDPELRKTSGDTAVCTFSVAVERNWKGTASGSRDTDFISCVAWRHTAEFVNQNFAKGQMIVVEGRLQMRDWTDDEGHKRRVAEVVTDQIYFAGGGKPQQQNPSADEEMYEG